MNDVAVRPGRPRRAWLVAALLAGGVAALGHAPVGSPLLALAGLLGIIAILERMPAPRAAFAAGWAAGAGYFGVSLHWLVEPFLVDAARHAWMAPFALLALAGGLALFWGAGTALAVAIAGGRRWTLALALPGAIALAEWLRGWIFTGFPWAAPSHAWADHSARVLFAWTGTTGFTLLMILAVTIPATVLGRRPVLLPLAVPAAFGAVAVVGQVLALPPLPELPSGQPVVRLVQPNAPQDQKWHPDHVMEFYTRQLDYTAAPGAPDLIVWSETSVPWPLDRAAGALQEIAAAAGGVPVAVGLQRRDPQGRVYNSLVVTGDRGQPIAGYDKHHLVPFGEYVPLAELAGPKGIAAFAGTGLSGFAPGDGPRILELPSIGTALPLICYELIFPRNIRSAPERPNAILHLTNDAWFGTVAGPQQHLAQAQVRAVEFGLPVLRAANTGISALIGADGAVLSHLPLGEAGYLDVVLPSPRPATFYARTGDSPSVAAALFLLVAAMALRSRESV